VNDILDGFRDPEVARTLVEAIHSTAQEPCTLMESAAPTPWRSPSTACAA